MDLGDCSVVEHEIDTGGAPPFRQQLRRQPRNVTDEIDSQVDKMLQAGVIKPSNSPWLSNVVMVCRRMGPSGSA